MNCDINDSFAQVSFQISDVDYFRGHPSRPTDLECTRWHHFPFMFISDKNLMAFPDETAPVNVVASLLLSLSQPYLSHSVLQRNRLIQQIPQLCNMWTSDR